MVKMKKLIILLLVLLMLIGFASAFEFSRNRIGNYNMCWYNITGEEVNRMVNTMTVSYGSL